MHLRQLPSFFLLFAAVILLNPSAAKAQNTCSEIFTVAPVIAQIETYELRFEKARSSQPRVFAALNAFIADAKKDSLILPANLLGEGFSDEAVMARKQFSLSWFKLFKENNPRPQKLTADAKNIREVSGGASEVYIVTAPTGTVVFRPAKEEINDYINGRSEKKDGGNLTVIRKTIVAYTLNRWLGLKSVPDTWAGSLNGQLGIFSEFIPFDIADNTWTYEINSNAPGFRNFHDLQAFEFLIGNDEASHLPNVKTRTENTRGSISHWRSMPALTELDPVVIDHDAALIPGLNPDSLWSNSLGHRLPTFYTKTFIEHLKVLTPAILIDRLSSQASMVEIQGILFRRALMLKDIELQGDKVLYKD